MARRAGMSQVFYVFGDGSQVKVYDVAAGTCRQVELAYRPDMVGMAKDGMDEGI